MKFLVVGLGSMGKRRIRNLKALDMSEIIGFDLLKDRCQNVKTEFNINTFTDFNQAMNDKPNVMIISTPPDLHMKYAHIAIENNMHFFTEASVTKEGMEELIKKLNNSKVVGLPSCTMRYHPIVTKINELLTEKNFGKVLAFTYHSGQYLPDWHPWEDYRKFYVAKKETGACREIVPFELVWITSTFGEIKNIIGMKEKISSLDVDIDDIYTSILQLKNNVRGVLIVDVISRPAIRKLTITTERGTISADWYKKSLNYYISGNKWEEVMIDDGNTEKNYLHGEKMYVKEIENLLKIIKNETNQTYTFAEDLKILKILSLIENSSNSGRLEVIK